MNREEFMEFFRNDEKLNQLTPDDRIEIFMQILQGNSDLTKDRLDQLLSDYGAENLIVIDLNNQK